MSSFPLRIRLGIRSALFTSMPKGARYLGTVQDGMRIGALVQLADGNYAQVNGDVVRVLNANRVRYALSRGAAARARSSGGKHTMPLPLPSSPSTSPPLASPPPPPPSLPTTVPIVIVKKRRLLEGPVD